MCTVDDTPRGALRPVLEDLPASLISIAGTSPTDVYAVGSDPGDSRGPFVIHYDGSGWRRLDTGATGALWWISVTPIDGSFYLAGDGGLVLRYELSSGMFTRQDTPPTQNLYGIWGTTATDLWAVGGDSEHQAAIFHFDGAMWTPADVSDVLPDGVPTSLFKVWGRTATDVYAVGQTGVVLHFNGGSWSLADSTATVDLFTLHGGGSLLAAVGGSTVSTGLLLEQMSNGSFGSRTPSGAPRLNGIFVPPSGNAVAVGSMLSVAARDASGWTLVDEGSDFTGRDYHATWIDSEDGIWAVGGRLDEGSEGVVAYGGPQQVVGGPVQ
jgi:hypothetical protein